MPKNFLLWGRAEKHTKIGGVRGLQLTFEFVEMLEGLGEFLALGIGGAEKGLQGVGRGARTGINDAGDGVEVAVAQAPN